MDAAFLYAQQNTSLIDEIVAIQGIRRLGSL